MKNGDMVFVGGVEVEFMDRKGGWTTYLDANGNVKKCRNSDVKQTKTGAREQRQEALTAGAGAVVSKTAKAKREKKAVGLIRSEKDLHREPRVDGRPFVIINPDLSRYELGLGKTANGRLTVDINDTVAAKLRGMPIDAVYEFASETLDETVPQLKAQYGHLNLGMQRMNLGNRCRKKYQKAV